MSSQEHTTFIEWLHLELDGELNPSESSQLKRHVAGCESCRRERKALAALEGALLSSRVEVPEEFHSRVMSALPATGWQARHPRTWAIALAVVALLGAGAAALVGSSAAQLEPAAPFIAASLAVLDLFRSSILAGSGLLSASWKGLGAGLQDVLGGSTWNFVAFAVVVLGVNVLLLRLLRRRERPAEAESKSRGD